MNIVDDIKSVSELKTHTKRVIDQVRATSRPIVITVKGKPAAVLIEASEYERLRQALALGAMLAEGEADIRAGRTRAAAVVFGDLRRAKKARR